MKDDDVTNTVAGLGCLIVLVNLAFVCVLIWGIIELVQWVTSK